MWFLGKTSFSAATIRTINNRAKFQNPPPTTQAGAPTTRATNEASTFLLAAVDPKRIGTEDVGGTEGDVLMELLPPVSGRKVEPNDCSFGNTIDD